MECVKGKRWGLLVVASMAVWSVLLIIDWPYPLLLTEHAKIIGIAAISLVHAGAALIILCQRNMYLAKQVCHLQELEKKLRFYSYYDAMSGTYNRNAFVQETKALETERTGLAVILCDIDGLKLINDTLGHSTGDQLIRVTAEILTTVCSAFGRVYRMGGDEFLVLFPNATTDDKLADFIQQIRQAVKSYNQQYVPLSISIGWAIANSQHTLTELIKIADCQMYQEKAMHREQVRQKLTQFLSRNCEENGK